MGIDYAIGTVQEAIMLDHRSQAFCSSNNRWFSNQAPDQRYTMNTVDTLDGRVMPQGPVPSGLSPGFGNLGENLHLSMSSSPTDAFDDLHRPTMDNGYGTCQSPGLDSVYSNRTNVGTPNSFITDYQADSPRERLFSTSSSTYAYSPYNVHEEATPNPTFRRQASSEMVEQFFNNSPCTVACTDDNGLLDSSSQGFATHCLPSTTLAEQEVFLPFNEYEDFLTRNVNVFEFPGITQLAGSPQNESTQASNNSPDNNTTTVCNSSSAPTNVVYSNPQNNSTQSNNLKNCHTHTLSRGISSLSDVINDTIPTNSQDAPMVSECVKSFMETSHFGTLNVEVLGIGPSVSSTEPHHDTEIVEVLVPQNVPKVSTPPKMQLEEDVATARREKNNAACRASRKRRKEKKNEMENSVGTLQSENEQLKKEIQHLEVECKRFKEEIFARMGQVSR